MGIRTFSQNKLLALLDRLQDAVFAIEEGRFVFVNDQTTRLFGRDRVEILGQPFIEFIAEEDRPLVMGRYQARQRGENTPDEYGFRIVNKQGELRDVSMRVGTILEDEGVITSVGSLQDITEQKKTRLALQHSMEDIASILNNMSDVFYRTDMQGVITMISPSSYDTIGYTQEEMLGRHLSDYYFNPADREKVVEAFVNAAGKSVQVESRLRHKDGTPVWVSTNAYVRLDSDHRPMCIEGIARNITEKKRMEERLNVLVMYDDLTQLFNRRYFLEQARQQFDVARRYGHTLSLLMLDLDWFKSINDSYGHEVGDMVLRHFAHMCREIFRKTDIVGRFGGEEFVVVMPETGVADARHMAERLRDHLAASPLLYGGHTIYLKFSAGLATLMQNDKSLDDLLRRADQLLYEAKNNGRNNTVISLRA